MNGGKEVDSSSSCLVENVTGSPKDAGAKDSLQTLHAILLHDVLNAHTVIQNCVSSLERRPELGELRELSMIRESVERASTISHDLLGHSMGRGAERTLSINEFARTCDRVIRKAITESIELKTERAFDSDTKLWVDPVGLYDAVLQVVLCTTAVKQGEGTLTVAIKIVGSSPDATLQISIFDDAEAGMSGVPTIEEALPEMMSWLREKGGDVRCELDSSHGAITRLELPRDSVV